MSDENNPQDPVHSDTDDEPVTPEVPVPGAPTATVCPAGPPGDQKEGDEPPKPFDFKAAIKNRDCTWLDIQHERIREIPDDAFEGLDKCEEVCLRYNLISSVV